MGTLDPKERHLKQLDLDAPLMSTRRSSGSADSNKMSYFNAMQVSSSDANRRVPFLWESSPGVPKGTERGRDCNNEVEFFPPKPPPSRWCLSREDDNNDGNYNRYNLNNDDDDDGNDADVDNGSYGSDDDDIFSDAMDKISLSDSLGITCSASSGDRSLSFIMNRFLPAANALATSNLSIPAKKLNRMAPTCSHHSPPEERLMKPELRVRLPVAKVQVGYVPQVKAQSYSPSKACGFVFFFPWNLKHALCGFKSPIGCLTPCTDLNGSVQRTKKCSSDGLNPEKNYGGGNDDMLSTQACQSPGWGLPFLDGSGLETRVVRGVDRGKAPKAFLVGKESGSRGDQRSPKQLHSGALTEYARQSWSLPPLKSPSESWLSHALNSTNKRY